MDIAEKKQLIDAQIAVHEAAIIELKRSRNTIQTLPTELLSHIFCLARDYTLALWSRVAPLRWIYVSHVCSHWRSVALGCPKLWSNIVMSHRPSASTLLERSPNVPLELSSHDDYSEDSHLDLWRKAISYISRIRKININGFLHFRSDIFTILAANLKEPAPALEVLRVFVSKPLVEGTPYLERQMPNLRSLDLTNCVLLRPLSFPLLTKLSLRAVKTGWAVDLPLALPLSCVIDSLRDMPLLEELSLFDTLAPFSAEEMDDLKGHKVKLLRLKRLYVTSQYFGYAEVCEVLEYPIDTLVSLSLDDVPSDQSSFASIIAVCSRLKHHKAPMIHRLSIYVDSAYRRFMFHVFDPNDDSLVDLDLRGIADEPHPFLSFNQLLCEAIPADTVCVLRVTMDSIFGSWLEFLAPFGRVETIDAHLIHRNPQLCRDFLDAISNATCVPRLRELMLRDALIGPPRTTKQPGVFSKIIHLLRTRKRAKVPIAHLQLVDCDIESAAMQALKTEKLVPRGTEISFTGIRQASDSDEPSTDEEVSSDEDEYIYYH